MTPLTVDDLLTTTRAVRRKLDFERPVPRDLIERCIDAARYAPTASDRQDWKFLVVDDPDKVASIAEVYGALSRAHFASAESRRDEVAADETGNSAGRARMERSADYLAENMRRVPALVIPCLKGRWDYAPAFVHANRYSSIYPAVWSFMLAARARELGTVWTTLHLQRERDVAEIVDIPHKFYTQCALIPIAYVKGNPFQRAQRNPLESFVHWNCWTGSL